MKKQNFKLTIDTPCQQDWSSMTRTDEGKYCSKCAKNVVDFTGLSDAEIIHLIEQNPGSLCGKLNAQQLNRTYIPSGYRDHPARQSRLYKILAGLLLVGATENVFAKENNFQETELVSPAESPGEKPQGQDTSQQQKDRLTYELRGIIIDANSSEPIPYATVALKGTSTASVTDLDGRFILNIPDSLVSDSMTMVIMNLGLEPVEIEMDRRDLQTNMEISIFPKPCVISGQELERGILGGLSVTIVTGEPMKKWWQFWK